MELTLPLICFPQKDKIYQQDVFSWCFLRETEKSFLIPQSYSHIIHAPTSYVAANYLNVVVQGAPSKILKKNLMFHVVWFSALCLKRC